MKIWQRRSRPVELRAVLVQSMESTRQVPFGAEDNSELIGGVTVSIVFQTGSHELSSVESMKYI